MRRLSIMLLLDGRLTNCGQLIGMLGDSERRLQWPPAHGGDAACPHRLLEGVARMKLVEEYSGVGALRWRDRTVARIPYRIARYQGMATSGLPVPGLHRIEGTVGLDGVAEATALVGADVLLELEDGRTLALTVADAAGRVLAEGHGPGRGCSCC
jgi:hypothetical protein